MTKNKSALIKSLIALMLSVSMLAGTTFAWFTDNVSSGNNIIVSGNIDVEMYWTDDLDNGTWHNVEDPDYNTIFSYDNWEPGYTDVKYIKIKNAGSLALNYKLAITPETAVGKLAEVINVHYATDGIKINDRTDLQNMATLGLLSNVLRDDHVIEGTLMADGQQNPYHPNSEVVLTLAMTMITTAGNDYQNETAGSFGITALATQAPYEEDSFGANYDSAAELPIILSGDTVSAEVENVNGAAAKDVTLQGVGVSATLPAGTLLEDGADRVTLMVTPLEKTTSGITAVNGEILIPVDVHVDGVAENNTTPIVVNLGQILPKGLNMGNYTLYHVEDGTNKAMTLVNTAAELTSHNTFTYDPVTGEVSVAMASFSEVALIADTVNPWNGDFATAFPDGDGTKDDPYIIANADQLAYMGDCVSNDNDNYGSSHYKLIADVNLGSEGENAPIFYPIGYHKEGGTIATAALDDEIPEAFYIIEEDTKLPANMAADDGSAWYTYGGSFSGTFDGNGHKVSNFYQNTWSMKGNYDGNYWNAAMGLFGYVNGGTVMNLTVDNFSSDGEFTPTGVIAAYAANSTFENIAITNCNPRVYNTGNGGIVGIGGNSSDPDTYKLTFNNITIDNTNKISALWGSWDVACGGLVGMFRGAGHAYMTNCHVAAQIDVYNDVCGNYQYYWYRYAGMMIGTNKNMTTDANGYTVPETDKFHAENCTVRFDEWNDYYYCELVANSLASYTHDHQFSRLTEVDAVDEKNKTYTEGGAVYAIPTSGRYNYVVLDGGYETENATCYHFVNGEQHLHEDAGYETVGGKTVLKEDKQHVYLPFNQLFTGYGWGVKHIPIYDNGETPFEGIKILPREVNTAVKFEANVENGKEYETGTTVSVGDLFKEALENEKNPIVNDRVQVFLSPVEGSNANGKVTKNADDWTKGTIALSGSGALEVTITDYYFCKAAKVIINVIAPKDREKFSSKFTGDFLYRVGNKNEVKLSTLFEETETVPNNPVYGDSVTVDVKTMYGSANGSYTADASDWTEGTLKLSGTGVVSVTISDGKNCIATVLTLEVIDATNITSATGTTSGGDMVLLCDVNTSTYVNYWNCTLYGNGFTYFLKGAPTAYNSKQGHGILITKNATLDNLVIVGDVYNSYGAYTNQDYYNAAVDVVGDTTIHNCYISGCAAPVSTRANANIVNTTLYGGTVANLIIKSGTVTLEDVTTANYDDGRSLVGMGIVIHSDATESAKLVLNGYLTQYNFMSESKVPSDTYAKNLHTTMFGDSCSRYHFGTSPNRYVNTGIISLTSAFNGEDITDNANTGYVGTAITVSGVNGYVYTQPNTLGSVDNDYDKEKDPHVSTTQGAVAPTYNFDYTNKNYVAKTEGSNDFCYEENGTVYISMDDGDTFNWDTDILTVQKYGEALGCTVSMNGTDYTGKSIAFNTADKYEVVYTYTDKNNYKLDGKGNLDTYEMTYTKTVEISVAVAKAATKHAEFTFGSSNTASTTVTIGNNTYVMPNVSATSSTIGSTTVSGQTIYYPIVEIVMSDGKTSHSSGWYAYFPVFSGAVTITDYKDNGLGDAETFGSSTQSMPSGLSIVGDPAQLFKYQSSSTAGTSPVVKNNILVYSSPSISAKRSEYNTVIQYSYQDNAGTTCYYYIGYHAPAQSYTSCFTSDTLITLADGSQKRVDEVTFGDKILAWDFFTGNYVEKDISILVNHGADVNNVIYTKYSDSTVLKLVGEHGVFDYDLNRFVYITAENVDEYIGHRFVKQNLNGGYDIVTMVEGYAQKEYVEAWSISSAETSNAFASGLLTVAPPEDFYNWIEMDGKLRYDVEKFAKDVETYGLYTYEDFSDYVTYEQFEDWNGAYLKIAVEKGYFTFEYILELIDLYKGWMA